MLYIHFAEELLGLQEVKITNAEKEENNITIHLEIERKSHRCPCCGDDTETIHDYRLQKIKDIPSLGKNVFIKLRKRRYRCQHCGKRFYENNSFLPRYFTYIFSLTTKQKNKQLLNCNCLHSNFPFISLPQLLTKSRFLILNTAKAKILAPNPA